jgi:hypothetical protein
VQQYKTSNIKSEANLYDLVNILDVMSNHSVSNEGRELKSQTNNEAYTVQDGSAAEWHLNQTQQKLTRPPAFLYQRGGSYIISIPEL